MKNNKEELNFDIDIESVNEVIQEMSILTIELVLPKIEKVLYKNKRSYDIEEELECCLKNERVEIKFIPLLGKIQDKKHPMWGGMSDNSKFIISVPRLKSGSFANVLTNKEKKYLEHIMGLEDNALSVYNRVNNYWSNNTLGGISKVILFKRDNYLDLSDPEDYIRYKILLACKDLICPDKQTLIDRPKSTYKFYIVRQNESSSESKNRYDAKTDAFVAYNRIKNDYNKLKTILEMITMKSVSKNSDINFIQNSILLIIDENARDFLFVINDELLDMKITIMRAVDEGIITKRANRYYLRSTNDPLTDNDNEEPSLTIAAKYLSMKKNQELLFSIQGKLNQNNN